MSRRDKWVTHLSAELFQILSLSDTDAKWSESMGLKNAPPNPRTKRYALVIDDLKVTYIGVSISIQNRGVHC